MILLYPLSEAPKTVRIAFEHGPEVFTAARDYYHHHKDMRCHRAVVYRDGALIANVIGTAQLVRSARPDLIPVVDLGMEDDPNQFAGDSGENVWPMFFEQLSPYSLQEVYNSQHVVLDQNTNLNFNPYLTELVFTNRRAEIVYGDDLRFNEKTAAHTKEVLDKIFTDKKKRTLGVIVWGTDYLLPSLAAFVPHGITAQETLEKAIRYVREQSFDQVYLATEDQEIFELFRDSELGSMLVYVDQKRLDYRKEENRNMLLMDVFAQDGSDPYSRTLDYIATLEGLTRCQALLANVTCGAVTYALGRRTAYEFVDVKKI